MCKSKKLYLKECVECLICKQQAVATAEFMTCPFSRPYHSPTHCSVVGSLAGPAKEGVHACLQQ